jgi:hypothetical protein
MRKILRSVYLDQEMDEALSMRADQERTTKAELMRAYIAAGLDQPARTHTRKYRAADDDPHVVEDHDQQILEDNPYRQTRRRP